VKGHAVRKGIKRHELLAHLFPDHKEYLFVTGLAGAARDVAALTDDGAHMFALGGVMGAATTIGLGMALGAPRHRVAVVTGDGELLMNIGSLVVVASAAPSNLTITCIDNERHGETGNQPGHTAHNAKLDAIGRGAGIASVMALSSTDRLADAAHFIKTAPGPRLLVAKVLDTEPSPYKRLMDPAACRFRFKTAFAASMAP
jgi:thiamine pyrophosphate-dependent acetolactate synthase large subunit-like protein